MALLGCTHCCIFSRECDSRITNVLGGCGYIKSWVWLYWKWFGYILSVCPSQKHLSVFMPISHHTTRPPYPPPKPLKIITIGHHVCQPSWHSTFKPIELSWQSAILPPVLQFKQAENGLQLWSSKNGKIAVWHYGLKLQGGWSRPAWMIGMDDWHRWLVWMIGMDDWHGWLAWMTGMDEWHGWLA